MVEMLAYVRRVGGRTPRNNDTCVIIEWTIMKLHNSFSWPILSCVWCVMFTILHIVWASNTPENILWSKSRKYKMGPKQKIQAEANAENTSWPHDMGPPPPAGGSSCGPLVFSAFASACVFFFLPHVVFPDFARSCISLACFVQLPCILDYLGLLRSN